MAALVERSPCAASRGGSTTNLSRSIVSGRPPAATAPLSSVAMRRWKSTKIFMKPLALSRKRAALSQLRRLVKNATMLGDGVAIGHAGDIVGDGARPALLVFGGCRDLRPFWRHPFRVSEEGFKEPPNDAIGRFALPRNARVSVHVGEEKALDIGLGRGNGRRKADERAARRAHVLDRLNAGGGDARAALDDRILNQARNETADKLMD